MLDMGLGQVWVVTHEALLSEAWESLFPVSEEAKLGLWGSVDKLG